MMAVVFTQNRPAEIVIAGHSFVRRLEDYITGTYGPFYNMNFEFSKCSINWRGKGKYTVGELQSEDNIYSTMADIIYIEIGCNDLNILDLGPDEVAA
jgi:hypothetical protein